LQQSFILVSYLMNNKDEMTTGALRASSGTQSQESAMQIYASGIRAPRDPGRVRHRANSANRGRGPLAIARSSAKRIAPAQHRARGRAKLHMSLLPVIDPDAIKQHRIAVNHENTASPRLGRARRSAYGVKASERRKNVVLPRTILSLCTPGADRWYARAGDTQSRHLVVRGTARLHRYVR